MPVSSVQSSEIPLLQINAAFIAADQYGIEQMVNMPLKHQFLTAYARDDGDISIIFTAAPEAASVPEFFVIAQTSDMIPANAKHLASFPSKGGKTLLHLFMVFK